MITPASFVLLCLLSCCLVNVFFFGNVLCSLDEGPKRRPEGGEWEPVGDWTFGSSPHPRKCSLTHLQGPTRGSQAYPKVSDKQSEAQAQRPRPSVTKDITFVRPKVTNGCSEEQVRRPGPSGTGIAFGAPRRKRKPSPGAGVRVKREYVRRTDLYT